MSSFCNGTLPPMRPGVARSFLCAIGVARPCTEAQLAELPGAEDNKETVVLGQRVQRGPTCVSGLGLQAANRDWQARAVGHRSVGCCPETSDARSRVADRRLCSPVHETARSG